MSGMTSYFARRLLLVPITFFAITCLVYTVLRVVPGGPIEQAEARQKMQAMSGEAGGGGGGDGANDLKLSEDGIQELKEFYSLDRSIPVGYLQWLGFWPRTIRTSVPPVPNKGNEEAIEALKAASEALKAAEGKLHGALSAAGLASHGSVVVVTSTLARAEGVEGPEAVLPEPARKEAKLLRDRTLGAQAPLQALVAAHGFRFTGEQYVATADDAPVEVTAALAARDAAKAKLTAVEQSTGYELRLGARLGQIEFRPLRRLFDVREEASTRLTAHLGAKKLVEFRAKLFAPLAKGEKLPSDIADEAKTLVDGGYGKRDDLLSLLWTHEYTWKGSKAYRLVPAAVREKDLAYFETADALLAARHLAESALGKIETEQGLTVRSGGRVMTIESRLHGIFEGEFGRSYTRGEPVLQAIVDRFPVSIPLGLTGLLLSWVVCIPLGVYKAVNHGKLFDTLSSAIVFLGYSIPGFVLCVVLLASVATKIDFIPIGGFDPDASAYDRFRSMIVPVMGYMVASFATMTILTKNSVMENLSQDYIRTAVAKGLSERRVLFVHALRNSLIPVTARIGYSFGALFAGSFLIEKACNIDGMGLLGFYAIQQRDYPIVLGILVFGVAVKLFGNILSDLIWAAIDPRIRFS